MVMRVRVPGKRAGQGAGPYRRFVGAAALGGPLAVILKISIENFRETGLTELDYCGSIQL